MPYNPGIAPRGEIFGQMMAQGGRDFAANYGQGLRLQEEQKRYDDVMKQRRRDRKQLKRSLGMQAELLGVDKEDIDTMGLGELQGFVEGTKLKTSLDYQGLQLQQLEDDIAQTAAGKRAIGQMQMYIEEQNLDPIEAATSAARDEGLELGEAAKLLNLATTGQKLGLELQTIQMRGRGLDLQEAGQDISRGTLEVQRGQLDLAKDQLEEAKKPTEGRVIDVDGKKYHQVGDRIFEVEEEGETDQPSLSAEGKKVTSNVDELLTDLQYISEGDDRFFLNLRSRQTYASKQIKNIAKYNREYKARHGKDHPDYIRLLTRVAPFIRDNKDSTDATNKKLARRLAEELGIAID